MDIQPSTVALAGTGLVGGAALGGALIEGGNAKKKDNNTAQTAGDVIAAGAALGAAGLAGYGGYKMYQNRDMINGLHRTIKNEGKGISAAMKEAIANAKAANGGKLPKDFSFDKSYPKPEAKPAHAEAPHAAAVR